MNDDAKLRKNWRRNWLDAITYFADIETQRKRWLDPAETNPHWTFVEIMCGYFDDCSLDLGYQHWIDKGHLTEEEAEAVEHFHAIANTYEAPNGDNYDNQAVLNDPKWYWVCEAARDAADCLHDLLTHPHEKSWIKPQAT